MRDEMFLTLSLINWLFHLDGWKRFSLCQVQEILDEDEALSTDPSQDDGEFLSNYFMRKKDRFQLAEISKVHTARRLYFRECSLLTRQIWSLYACKDQWIPLFVSQQHTSCSLLNWHFLLMCFQNWQLVWQGSLWVKVGNK